MDRASAKVTACRHCWHDTRAWDLTIDGVTIIQTCCHCPADRTVGLVTGLVIEGDRPHGPYAPLYRTYHYSLRGIPKRESKIFDVGAKATLSDKMIRALVLDGLRTEDDLRRYIRAVKQERPSQEAQTKARWCRKVLHNHANMERFRQIAEQVRAQAA